MSSGYRDEFARKECYNVIMRRFGGLVTVSKKHILADSLFTVVTLIVVFSVNLFLVEQFDTKTMTPMIFVLGVFLVSWRTQG